MIEGHIFIQGIISPWQDNDPGAWGEVNIKSITQQIQDNADAEKLIVHIHSPGGDVDEGFGIHDILVVHSKDKGVEIETRIEGLCASIATVIAMAGSVRSITENSEFMIHNPWGQPKPGDAEDIQKYADNLKAVEDKVAKFYAVKIGSTFEEMSELMKDEIFITAEKAKDLGFVTEIITTIKAVAKFKQKNTVMNNELEKTIDTKFETFFDKIKGLFKTSIKMLTTTAADGTVLDFGDQVETVEEIAVGMTATIEGGGVPDGDVVMPDGGTWVFDNGTLTEMKEAETEDELEALKKENSELKEQLEAANASNKETEIAVQDLEKELTDFKAQIKSDISTFEKSGVVRTQGKAELVPGKPIIGI